MQRVGLAVVRERLQPVGCTVSSPGASAISGSPDSAASGSGSAADCRHRLQPPPTPAAPAASPGGRTAHRPRPRSDFRSIRPRSSLRPYDAGRGQRYYLFGSELPFAALVKYYQSALKNRGTLVFDAPATHVFEIGRFREETMAFPPGVTIKDYTWNGSAGYLNPKKNGQPARFPSIIQIVPAPPAPALERCSAVSRASRRRSLSSS